MDPKLKNVLKGIPGGEEVIEKFCLMFPSLNSTASNVTQVNVTQGGAAPVKCHLTMVSQNNEAYSSGGGGGKLLASTSTVNKLDSK